MNFETPHFSGTDWQTDRRSLAQLLCTLDGMQSFTHGMMVGNPFLSEQIVEDHVCAGVDAPGLSENDQLRVLGELAEDALAEADFLAADLAASDVPARVRWTLVEARQLIVCVRELSAEARQALNYKNLEDIPTAILMEFEETLRRVKLLLIALDEPESHYVAA